MRTTTIPGQGTMYLLYPPLVGPASYSSELGDALTFPSAQCTFHCPLRVEFSDQQWRCDDKNSERYKHKSRRRECVINPVSLNPAKKRQPKFFVGFKVISPEELFTILEAKSLLSICTEIFFPCSGPERNRGISLDLPKTAWNGVLFRDIQDRSIKISFKRL